MSSRASAFDKALRDVAVPALAAHGFKFDGSRTFRRLLGDGRSSQIVNFQLGQRSLEGTFTVNLGIFIEGDRLGVRPDHAKEYDCQFERRTRIGALIPPRFPRLASLPLVGMLFGIPDKWWPFSDDLSRTCASVSTAVDMIAGHGLGWLSASRP